MKFNSSKTTAWLGAAVLSLTFVSTAGASCGTSRGKLGAPQFAFKAPKPRAENAPAPLARNRDLGSRIVGLWLTSVLQGGQVIYQAFESFTSDGLEILNDSGSPAAGNVCLGVWSETEAGIVVNHPSWSYDEAGNLSGMVTIGSTITLDKGSDTFRGTVTIDVYDLQGKLVDHEVGQLMAQRITVD